MKQIAQIGRIIAGIVFIFSGLSKGVDPEGSMYKFIDYFTAFGLDSINNLALVMGIVLSTAEFIIGVAALSGIRIKEAAWALLVFMAGFTPLTLVLAINNPVSDCGCFGDAIHLSNWQTFYKNVLITALVVPVFIYRKRFRSPGKALHESLVLITLSFLFILFSLINLMYLPLIDFRPYAEGENIKENMTIPEGAPIDEYETVLIYEKDGIRKEFTIENYPDDPDWTFVDQKSTLISKGYEPPIHDFILITKEGFDLTDMILSDPGYTIMLISKSLEDAPAEELESGIETCNELFNQGFSSYLLSSSSIDEMLLAGGGTIGLSGDETMIKTIIRSNPGFLLLSEGRVLKKWSYRSFPGPEEIIVNIEHYASKKHLNIYIKLLLAIGMASLISLCLYLLVKKLKN